MSAMSDTMLARIVGCKTAAEVWERVHVFFLSHTKAKTQQLRTQLQNTRKGNMSISDYLLKIKLAIDALIAIGSFVSINDHIEYIFDGLTEEYDPFVASITIRKDPYTVSDIESLLLAQEARIKRHNSYNANTSINMAQSGGRFYNSRGGRGGRFSNKGGRNRGRSSGIRSLVICQLCGKQGHLVGTCWYRFDKNFQEFSTAENRTSFISRNHQRTNNANALLLTLEAVNESFISGNHQRTNNAHALLATPEAVNDNAWYLDSGGSSHITHNQNILMHKTMYNGDEKVHIGDGTGLSILHSGFSYVQTFTSSTLVL